MISQMPITSVSVTRESNGDASTMMPARVVMTPKKIDHPRAGRCGSLTAATVVATPRKTKPTPIQMAGRRDGQAEREDHLRHATNHQIDAEKNRRNDDRFPRPHENQNTQDHRQQSGEQCGLPQMMQQTWPWLVNVSHNEPLSWPNRKPGRIRFVLCP